MYSVAGMITRAQPARQRLLPSGRAGHDMLQYHDTA